MIYTWYVNHYVVKPIQHTVKDRDHISTRFLGSTDSLTSSEGKFATTNFVLENVDENIENAHSFLIPTFFSKWDGRIWCKYADVLVNIFVYKMIFKA